MPEHSVKEIEYDRGEKLLGPCNVYVYPSNWGTDCSESDVDLDLDFG